MLQPRLTVLAVAIALAFIPPHLTTARENTGAVTATGEMTVARFDHTATLLASGQVLIAGGLERNGVGQPTAELFDPGTGRFSPAGTPRFARTWGSTATRLADGRVLIAGGAGASCGSCRLAEAELYDPATRTFTATGSMTMPRAAARSILLPNGDVFVAGGDGDSVETTAPSSSELYHPASGTFSPGPHLHVANPSGLVLLKNGSVVIAGTTGVEVYQPASRRLDGLAKLPTQTTKFGTALLPNGRVMIAGGQTGGPSGPRTSSTLLYDPVSGTLSAGPDLKFKRYKLMEAAVALNDGRVLIGGGAEQAEIFDPRSATFAQVPGPAIDGPFFSTATLLRDGRVLLAGGYPRGGAPGVRHAWLYTP